MAGWVGQTLRWELFLSISLLALPSCANTHTSGSSTLLNSKRKSYLPECRFVFYHAHLLARQFAAAFACKRFIRGTGLLYWHFMYVTHLWCRWLFCWMYRWLGQWRNDICRSFLLADCIYIALHNIYRGFLLANFVCLFLDSISFLNFALICDFAWFFKLSDSLFESLQSPGVFRIIYCYVVPDLQEHCREWRFSCNQFEIIVHFIWTHHLFCHLPLRWQGPW